MFIGLCQLSATVPSSRERVETRQGADRKGEGKGGEEREERREERRERDRGEELVFRGSLHHMIITG